RGLLDDRHASFEVGGGPVGSLPAAHGVVWPRARGTVGSGAGAFDRGIKPPADARGFDPLVSRGNGGGSGTFGRRGRDGAGRGCRAPAEAVRVFARGGDLAARAEGVAACGDAFSEQRGPKPTGDRGGTLRDLRWPPRAAPNAG